MKELMEIMFPREERGEAGKNGARAIGALIRKTTALRRQI